MKKYISIFLLIAILFTIPIATARADDENPAGLYIYGVSPRMIEPWGMMLAMKATDTSQISLADDYGMIVISSEDYSKAESTDIESLLQNESASSFKKDDIDLTNGYYSVCYEKEIYTYQLDKKFTVVPFIYINGEYVPGKIYECSILDVVNKAISNSGLPQEIRAVLNDMSDLYNITKICYEEDGITSVNDTDMSNVRRGDPNLMEQGVTAVVDSDDLSANLGSSPRTCEPWGLNFVTAYKDQDSLYDFGTIVIDTSKFENMNYLEILYSSDAYIFSHRDGTLSVNEETGLCYSKLEGIIKTYQLDIEYLCVPYVMKDENTYIVQLNYANDLVSRTTLQDTIVRACNSGKLNENKIQLFEIMQRYYRNLKYALGINISYAPLSYTVTYSLENDATLIPETQHKFWGIPLALCDVVPVRDGYVFLGWSTSQGSSTVAYICGEEYYENSDVTLYGVWIEEDKDYGGGVVKP